MDFIDQVKQEQGYIYVIKVFDYYKIGKTQNPNNRFGEYTKLMQEPEVIVLRNVYNYHNVEIKLHQMFEHKHTRGEWYELNDNDIELIRWYIEMYTYPFLSSIISMYMSDLLKEQITNMYNGIIEVRENDVVIVYGKTKIPICTLEKCFTIDNFDKIIQAFSKFETIINSTMEKQNQEEHAS